MKQETVFEFGGEGGSISISRISNKSVEKFIYHHNEFDPDKEHSINKTEEYNNFEDPFQLINNRYPWYSLYILAIHDDYKKYIAKELIKILNIKVISPDNLQAVKGLEEWLNIKLEYTKAKGDKGNYWSCIDYVS